MFTMNLYICTWNIQCFRIPKIMATVSVGARDQISLMCGKHTMRPCCVPRTSAQVLYAKALSRVRAPLWVSDLHVLRRILGLYILRTTIQNNKLYFYRNIRTKLPRMDYGRTSCILLFNGYSPTIWYLRSQCMCLYY